MYEHIVEKEDQSVYPNFIKVNIGDSATIFCDSVNAGRWFFHRNDSHHPHTELTLSDNLKMDPKKLIIESINVEYSGYYFCVGQNVHKQVLMSAFVGKSLIKVYGK